MAVKKSELYSTLWKCCDELRGGMDASQYKDYVLVILFVKYISDKRRNDEGFDIDIPEGCYFEDFVALKGTPNIGEEMNKKMAALAEANQLGGVFVADFEDDTKLGKGKDKVETLSKLIAVFQNENLDFGKNRAADDDLIGDAYEYLMRNFATESGKSKGQFYTPAEVSRVMAKLIGLSHAKDGRKTTIYDPTCGSGSLLLRAMCETPGGATLYGQEKDNATVGLAKMNMILHNEIYADIRQGDTINDPQFKENDQLKTFDYIVANPPFSTKSWLKSAKVEDEYHRWGEGIKIGVPPEKNGDYAFLLHIVRSLKHTGCAACILPHGVLFRGNAEAHIRKYLVAEKRYIKGVIGLPANLFYGTGIPACIIVVEKSEAAERKGVFMIDAKSGFIKDGAKNRLREQDIRRIVDVWEAQRDVPHFARFVPMEEIARNDYNLNIPRYVSAPDTEILQDIDAHLHGGLPEHDINQLDTYWDACPSLRNDLFCSHPTRQGYYSLRCKQDAVRDVVAANIDFCRQNETFRNSFNLWCDSHRAQLYALAPGFAPKILIEQLGDSLLSIFKADRSLVDAYDVYDCLMNYWSETMQDDCYMISSGGWTVQLYTPQPSSKKKDEKKKEKKAATPEDVVCDLLPVPIVIDEYFAEKRDIIAAAEELLTQKEAQLAELVEEQAENYLDEDNFPDGKMTDANIKKRVKALDKKADADEIAVLQQFLDLKGDISLNKKLIKERKYDLLTALVVKYANLSEDEIKRLVIERKWFASLALRLDGEMQRISQQLTSKVSALAERYAQTLPEIDTEIADLEAKVAAHLKQMGY
ncbi:type I restriction-modification system subunit M [Barnesiella viscericola]|uniref:type I restriction-modification system subunit M n=1 Tax=Barnesiella viscericola TaxID=397865 RepID=UPI0025A33131|nr:type I restriction-modification system subunit M [Barnesiella viscericola]MDM8269878.1 type I restriction-modification system subunit M [Barnesiella viscericola]